MHHTPELRSRPGLNARLLTVGESLSQQMVLETLVLKLPSNLNTDRQTDRQDGIRQTTCQQLMEQNICGLNPPEAVFN